MSSVKFKEDLVPAPWGNIAIISCGNPEGEPILLVHGGEDSAATFVPLLELLPDKYHYVALDLPGHGKSDPFPVSVVLLRIHFVASIEAVAQYMQWKQFVMIGHSMGAEIGCYYEAIYPKKVKKFIHLDPGLALQVFFLETFKEYMVYYEEHYGNDWKSNDGYKIYTKQRALDGVMKARKLTKKQAELILSRNLIPVGKDQFRLSWNKYVKFPKAIHLPYEYYLAIFSKCDTPTLVLAAKISKSFTATSKECSDKLLAELAKKRKHFYVKMIDGNHDLHLTHPEKIVNDICTFLGKDSGELISKL